MCYKRNVPSFQESYDRLNPEQKRAVDTIEGPVMVLAGPGTGKTQVLTTRIAKILQTAQVAPSNILALTFTQSAAKNMQERLVSLIGPTGYGVRCTTFHSFCSDVIAQFPEFFPLGSRSSEALGKLEAYQLIEKILVESDVRLLRGAKSPHTYVREVIGRISDYKREGYDPERLLLAVEAEQTALDQSSLSATKKRSWQKIIEKNRELVKVFEMYEEEKLRAGRFDYDDMILWVRESLVTHDEVLAHYQEQYQYVLIDEFQDTNTAQLQVVSALLAHWGETANIFVVGDPHQSIYRFQGASLANTFGFLDQYPEAEVITLRTGYRCGQKIYDAAAHLLTFNGTEADDDRLKDLALPLQQPSGKSGDLSVYGAPDILAECLWIAQKMQELHDTGVPYQEMAVLYRNHSHVVPLREVLDRLKIPSLREGSRNIFEVDVVRQLVVALRFLVAVQSSDEAPYTVPFLRLPWLDFDQQEIWRFLRTSAVRSSKNPWEAILSGQTQDLSPSFQEKMAQLASSVSTWVALDGTTPVSQIVERFLLDTKFYAFMKAQKQLHEMSAVVGFLRWVEDWSSRNRSGRLEDFLAYLDLIDEHDISLSSPELQLETDAVRLATAHQAKGQEWEYVFVLNAMSGRWDNQIKRSLIVPLENTVPYSQLSSKERNEDERRLFYVALTRAKKQVWLTWSARIVSGEVSREQQRSQFVEEIGDFCQELPVISADDALVATGSFFQSRDWAEELNLDRVWLQSAVRDFALSASSYNTFLRCPAAFLFRDILRLPFGENNALVIGTAVHAAMEFVGKQRNLEGTLPPQEEIQRVIRESVRRSRLPEEGIRLTQRHAQETVHGYLESIDYQVPVALMIEKAFGRQYPVMLENIPLVGKIDRIEEISPGLVRVIDYKTMKPVSPNVIQGKTKDSDGEYWRQLLFYRLLCDQDPEFRGKVAEAQIVFLEPNDSGKYKKESFTLLDEEVAQFTEELKQQYATLQSLSFLDEPPCGECDVCKTLGFASSV